MSERPVDSIDLAEDLEEDADALPDLEFDRDGNLIRGTPDPVNAPQADVPKGDSGSK